MARKSYFLTMALVPALLLTVLLFSPSDTSAAVGCPAGSSTYTVTLHAHMDTFIDDADPYATHGPDTLLEVGRFPEHQMTLMMFDSIGTTPFNVATDCILDARLDVFTDSGIGLPHNVQIRRVNGPWNNGTNWFTRPPLAGPYAIHPMAYPNWNSFNVTALVDQWAHGVYPDYGLAITDTPPPNYLYRIRSIEYPGAFGARIEVTIQRP